MEYDRFPADIRDKLKYYVYIYLDPDTNKIFYVGKGKGDRAFSHLKDQSENDKVKKIAEIRGKGKTPKIEILVHGLENEETALKVEAAVIDLIGIDNLTNRVHGYESILYGRLTVEQLIQRYNKEEANIEEPSILIRISQLFHYGMAPSELYDITRGSWRLGENRQKAKLAFAIYNGVIQEVYSILQWFKSGKTFSTINATAIDGRWEFVGGIAPDEIRSKYLNKTVNSYFKHGSQNPVVYVNISDTESNQAYDTLFEYIPIFESLKNGQSDDFSAVHTFFNKAQHENLLLSDYSNYMTTAPVDTKIECKRINNADSKLLLALLTCCYREDCFSGGAIQKHIKNGDILNILKRLKELYKGN